MRLRISIRYLLLAANSLILLMPVFAVVFFHLWEGHLVRLTEQQLIAESVLLGESWRERVAEAPGAVPRPKAESIEPMLELDFALDPTAPAPTRSIPIGDGAAWRAGREIAALLGEAERVNHSEARILDGDGCIVATTGTDLGVCFESLPEVRSALSGRYAAAARERLTPSRLPPFLGLDREGKVRVYTAVPVREGDRILGVVHLSRTTSSPLEVFWRLRYTVLAAALLCLTATAVVSLFLSRAISRPIEEITGAAEEIARGEAPRSFRSSRLSPKEVAALGEALDAMTNQLTDRAAYIAQFATTVSHELKTPLAGIRGAVELLREDWADMTAAQRQRFLENVEADATRMERLVTRLLQLARIQSSPEMAEPIEVAPFFERLLARFDGRVRLDLSSAPEAVVINPDHLETAVRNLVDNAVRHGGEGPVDVRVHRVDGRLAVEVRDRGPGISEGNRAHLFERFFTTDRDRGGTGLGLAIVRAVADTRAGEVSFVTGTGGTTFTLVV